MSILEILMLVFLGAAWPFSIIKSWKSKKTGGKSIIFLFSIFLGYFFGIIHKIVYSLDFVIFFYCLNAMMVLIDIALYYRNRRLGNCSITHGRTAKLKI